MIKLQKPVPLKRQQYMKGKMSLKVHPFVKLKSNKIIKVKHNLQVNVDKTNTEKEEHKYTDAKEENKKASSHSHIEAMIKEGKGVEDCAKRKETLENILSVLDSTGVGGEKVQKGENEEICKIDEQNTSNVMDSELTEKAVELQMVMEG